MCRRLGKNLAVTAFTTLITINAYDLWLFDPTADVYSSPSTEYRSKLLDLELELSKRDTSCDMLYARTIGMI